MVGACVYWRLVDGSILSILFFIILTPKNVRKMVVNFIENPNTMMRPCI